MERVGLTDPDAFNARWKQRFPLRQAHLRNAAWDQLPLARRTELIEWWQQQGLMNDWTKLKAASHMAALGEQLAELRAQRDAEERAAVLARIAEGTYPPPGSQLFGVSPEGAERWCCEWMRHLGTDAQVTRFSSDGGVDIRSTRWVAQVKHYTGSVDVLDVRALAGSAASEGREGAFFTSGNYTQAGIDFAELARLSLFTYNVQEGTISPTSERAHQVMVEGM